MVLVPKNQVCGNISNYGNLASMYKKAHWAHWKSGTLVSSLAFLFCLFGGKGRERGEREARLLSRKH